MESISRTQIGINTLQILDCFFFSLKFAVFTFSILTRSSISGKYLGF